jgi:hypothetical protein
MLRASRELHVERATAPEVLAPRPILACRKSTLARLLLALSVSALCFQKLPSMHDWQIGDVCATGALPELRS